MLIIGRLVACLEINYASFKLCISDIMFVSWLRGKLSCIKLINTVFDYT